MNIQKSSVYQENKQSTFLRKSYGFTLVELIVVITILVILGTIAFISLGGYSSSARDASRSSDLSNISKGLEISLLKNGTIVPPDPANKGIITITASGNIIGYQGYVGSTVLNNIRVSEARDPLDKTYYTYTSNASYSKYQLLTLLENNTNITLKVPGIETVFAGYEIRVPATKGSTLGTLLGNTGTTLYQPIQEGYSAGSFTGVDIVNTSTGYLAVFSKTDTLSGTGNKLAALKISFTSSATLPLRDTSLIGYWDMETIGVGGRLAEMSGNGNGGITNGGILLGGTSGNGKNGAGTIFDGVDDLVTIPTAALNFSNSSKGTVSAWVKPAGCGSTCYIFVSDHTNADSYLYLAVTSGQTAKLSVYNGAFTVLTGIKNNLMDGKWHMITGQWDTSGIRIYIDGKLDASNNSINGTISGHPPGKSYIGADYYNTTNYDGVFNGSIDDIRVYNRILPESEIFLLYNATK